MKGWGEHRVRSIGYTWGSRKKTMLFLKHVDFVLVAKIRPFMFGLVEEEENESGEKILVPIQHLVREFMDNFH